MRIRTLKPEFWQHFALSQCAEFTRLLAIALLNWADDEGYFSAHPALLRGSLFPFEEDGAKIRRSLDELSAVGWIQLGDDQQGRPVGRVINFAKHQKVDRPKSSSIKALWNIDEASSNNKTTPRDDSPKNRRSVDDQSLLEWKGMEGNGSIGDASPSREESSNPSTRPPQTIQPPEPPTPPADPPKSKRPPDPCFEALVTLHGSRMDQLTGSERGRINKALSEIRAACPALTPAVLRQRAEAYREAMPRAPLTATALAAHWSRLAPSGPPENPEKNLRGAARHFDPDAVPAAPEGWREAFAFLQDMEPDGEWHQQQPYVREEVLRHLAAMELSA